MRSWVVLAVISLAGNIHAVDSPIPDSFKKYKRMEVENLYIEESIVSRSFVKKMEMLGDLENVTHASFKTNGIDFTIFFDGGPSADPSYEITALKNGKTSTTSVEADRLFISAEGALYAEARTNRNFNMRKKLVLGEEGFKAVPQPYYLVDEDCPLVADLTLTSEPCGKGQILAKLPGGSKAHILAAPISETCPQDEKRNDQIPFLVSTPFGLLGWAQTKSGDLNSSGSPLGCIRYMGD